MTRYYSLEIFASWALLGCIAERTVEQIIEEHGVTAVVEASSSGTEESSSEGGDSTAAQSTRTTGMSETVGGGIDDMSGATSEESGEEASTSVPTDLPRVPVCGDGLVEGEETCDDQNDVDDDGCRACARDSVVFVTSELYQGGAIGGLDKADSRCRGLAAMAGLTCADTYRAWLSSQTVAAKDRLHHSNGRYVLVNGLVVANDWDELVSGELQNPINVTERSETNLTAVWTGTSTGGKIAAGSTLCDDWTDDTLEQLGGFGDSPSHDIWWTFGGHAGCGGEAAIYCMEQ